MDTITALSTPRGIGALSVIRLSGPRAVEIVRRIAPQVELKPRLASLAKIFYPGTTQTLDQVLITYFPGPRSMTGEDVVELSCHGSPAVVQQLINFTLEHGARLAGPGEFSLRALHNGKIDLAQAEAVKDLIESQTQAAAKQAALQVSGEFARVLGPSKARLIDAIVILESSIEFVEDDLPALQLDNLRTTISSVHDDIAGLRKSYRVGRLLKEGFKVAILGQPNVGKSSLFNKLITRDRAIVTAIPGTTRDTLSESIEIEGIPVTLTDTAGLRETNDEIEVLGIGRTQGAAADADIVLLVFDFTKKIGEPELALLDRTTSSRRLLVVNKSDLERTQNGFDPLGPAYLQVSAKTGNGIDELRKSLVSWCLDLSSDRNDGLVVTNLRHHDLLKRTEIELEKCLGLMATNDSEELVVAPLHNALRLLGEVTGETSTEDVLSQIFSTFCIGK